MTTLVFGHKNPDTDSITSTLVMTDLQTKLGMDVKACRLGELNKETQYILNYFSVEAPELIDGVTEADEVILVDHNEFNQSATGIEKATIKMVVDHHRIANFQTSEPLFYRAEPVGCTGTILYKMYKENNVEIDAKMAGLMASAIISDSLLFKSPTCTPQDEKACRELAEIAGLEVETYGLEMLKAGTDLSDLTAGQLLGIDAKVFPMGASTVEIAQINVVSIEDMMTRKAELEAEMKSIIDEKGLNLFVAVITDILNSNSQIIALGERTDIVEKAFNVELTENTTLLEGVVSRKKQIVPVMDRIA
ncbi:manganese-dependent inorganic pyrophosphatase [Turicibacter sp. 1E2]|uniref:inorganic diphosphatase n=1 Tax=Turicibacter faecis TaxID=2963365 RepID=A0ABN6ZHA1_9FIRM|nr:manganese-dependent inorganic pyrophosphatase [Turicibacter sp. 1E2]MCU7209348.1 manganese-dependent inorganic pyrophosphatase [Turicibacter sp. 1E2]BEH91183.1 manganese-dependent inorganic pyrophosphatase [Turicibacter sp. TC023]